MQSSLSVEAGHGLEIFSVLGIGAAVVIVVTAVIGGSVASAIWRRTIWRVATAALILLIASELTGLGPALVQWARARAAAEDVTAVGITPSIEVPLPPSVEFPVFETLHEVPIEREVEESSPGWHGARWEWHDPVDTSWSDGEAANHAGNDRLEFLPAETPAVASDGVLAHDAVRGKEDTARGTVFIVRRWILWIWGLGAIVLAGRIIGCRLLLSLFSARRVPVRDEALRGRVVALGHRLGLRRPVRLLWCDGLSAPVAFGVGRPTVALPTTFADDFDIRQQEAILAHELAHLAARDPLWHLLADLVTAALWWHPLVWWSRRQLRGASELAADEASLVVPGGATALAEGLVAIGRRLSGAPRLEWLSIEGTGFRSSLGRRVQRLLNLPGRTGSTPRRERLALAGIGLPVTWVLIVALCTAWVRPQVTLAEGESDVNLLNASWRRSLAAMALAGWLSSPGTAPADESPGEEPTWLVAAADPQPQDDREHREAEERERAERERPQDDLNREEQKLERDLHRLEMELREIPEQDGERREQLHRKLEHVRERLEDVRRPKSDRPRDDGPAPFWAELRERAAELMGKRRELEERGNAIRREVGDALADPSSERGQAVRRQMEEVKREAEEVRRAATEMVERQMREVGEQVRQMRESGQHEAAERMLRQAGKWMGEVKQMGELRPEPHKERMPDDLQRRIQHLKVAIDNLRAAGFHEPAEHLQGDVERMIREHRERAERQHDGPRHEGPPHDGPPRHDGPPPGPPRPDGPRYDGPPRHDGPPPGPPRPGPEMNSMIEQLREEQRQMRDEMHELREMIKRLVEREQR